MSEELQNQNMITQTQHYQPVDPENPNCGGIVGYFHEDNGNHSSMRLMCFISLLAAIVFGALTIFLNASTNADGDIGIYITFGFLISAFAPKAVQKFAEQKIPQIKK